MASSFPLVSLTQHPHTAINVHASLLPKYRGAAPDSHAIWKGDHETELFPYMTKEMDCRVLAQRFTFVESNETVGDFLRSWLLLGGNYRYLFKLLQKMRFTAVGRNVSQSGLQRLNYQEQELSPLA